MEPHQQVLVDQAIRHILTRYDDRHCLLRSSDDPRFRVVQESLAFAALLLARAAAGHGRKSELGLARLLLDTILPLQNRTRRDPARGAFPLLWTPDARRARVMDPDSREIMGSILGLLLKDYSGLLGGKRCQRVREAVRLCLRGAEHPAPENTSHAMIAAWLEVEFGDTLRGERLATEVALAGQEQLSSHRFGDARAFARELWALSLWRRSSHLHASVQSMVEALVADVTRYAHPSLPEVFGGVTVGAGDSPSRYAWLGTWLTWHALCGQPFLPRNMDDPLHSTLFAFPSLARLELPAAQPEEAAGHGQGRSLVREGGRDAVSGWWENGLHVEARSSAEPVPDGTPVAGARWRTPSGTTVGLRCRVSGQQKAVCQKRFVHLEDPGVTVVTVRDLGAGEVRMIDNGWWLSGLHFAMEGFRMVDAQRSPEGLTLQLKPTDRHPVLLFAPLG